MKPIGNIFGFDCVACEHNRNCYGGNMGNQFRYCQKSIEKLQNIEKLEQENKELKRQIEDISEELELVRCDLHNRTSERDSYEREINECLSQQKEFIKYLEDMLDDENDIFSVVRVKDVLQKHKEIIEV